MRKDKLEERSKKRAADKLAALLGITDQDIIDTEVEKAVRKEEVGLEAEAVLYYIRKPGAFITKLCLRCEEPFATNYKYVTYCSDNCRRKALLAIGIKWDSSKRQEDRWRGEPPLVIPATALAVAKGRAAEYESPVEESYQETQDEKVGEKQPPAKVEADPDLISFFSQF